MSYTVKQLAKLSGVSARTLRFYDEIGLLKPAYYGDNQYRYYSETELLLLQQILFFRELGFPLADIQRILGSDDFDKIASLKTHKSRLQSNLHQTKTLIKTIDKTISHLKGKLIMRDAEMFEGFDPIKQQEHETYLVETGVITQQQVDDSWKKAAHWKKQDWEQFKNEGDQLNNDLTAALNQGLAPSDKEVQALIQRHYNWVNYFWTPTKTSYDGLAQMYLDHPDFRAFYNRYHPQLVEYIVEAMRVFIKTHLS